MQIHRETRLAISVIICAVLEPRLLLVRVERCFSREPPSKEAEIVPRTRTSFSMYFHDQLIPRVSPPRDRSIQTTSALSNRVALVRDVSRRGVSFGLPANVYSVTG